MPSFLLSFILGLGLFYVVNRKRAAPSREIPLSLFSPPSTRTIDCFRAASRLFSFLFCLFFVTTSLSLLFPAFASSSWLIPFYPDRFKPAFSYSATLFIVDHSSSMETPFQGTETRLEFAKESVSNLVDLLDRDKKGKDEFGLIQCARLAPIIVPMTRNRDFFLKKLNAMQPETKPLLNGSALGYALFKGLYLIEAMTQYAETNQLETLSKRARSIVILTDGFEEPNPLDKAHPFRFMHMKEALQLAQSLNIRVWYLVLAKPVQDLVSTSQQTILFRLASMTHGGYLELVSSADRDRAFQEIARSIQAYEESTKEGVDRPFLFGIELILLILCFAIMRFFEQVGCRISSW